MYSFGFEKLDTGELSAGVNKVEGSGILVWLVKPDSVNAPGCGLAY